MKRLLALAACGLAWLSAACDLPFYGGSGDDNCQVSQTPSVETSIENGRVTLKWAEGEQDFTVQLSPLSAGFTVDIEGGVPAEWELEDGGTRPSGWTKARIATILVSLSAGALATLVWCRDPYARLLFDDYRYSCSSGTSSDAVIETLDGTVVEKTITPDDASYTVHGMTPSGAAVDLVMHRRTVQRETYSGYGC